VLVAGSTHTGEEELILTAVADLPPTKIILAPRHLERLHEVVELCKRRELRCALLSTLEPQAADWDVLIVDRYGLLVDCYRVADLVVMGGTFHPQVGGHNILEATALGKPVIVGPHTYGIAAQVELLDAARALAFARNEQELRLMLYALRADPLRRARMGAAGRAVTEANHGAARRAAEQVLRLL
jgi:3-deoxy-D-manno-octulosonic-acid transferase